MKKGLFLSALLSSFLALTIVGALNTKTKEAKAEELSLNSGGDSFNLLDKLFTANESFVYTADLHFKSGQAGGLAFGCEENAHYFVINMDRYENHVKLIYFYKNDQGNIVADEIKSDYFIGNDKTFKTTINIASGTI